MSNSSEETGSKRSQFKPGQSGNPKGRPKGARSRLGERFWEALQQDFEQHGASVVAKVRKNRPDVYLRVIAATLPKDLNINVNVLEGMSDDELASAIENLRALSGAGAPQPIGVRSAAAQRH